MKALDHFKEARGRGSVTDVPNLPDDFADRFTSRLIPSNGVRHHVVAGGEGPVLLLLGGWPQNWFAWRYLMPALAEKFTVIAAESRGVGLSEKPTDGYDSATLATDMVGVMDALGVQHFSVVGYDVGMWTAYAMAVDYPGRIQRMAMGEAVIPGIQPSPPLIADDRWLNDALWHFNFNRALEVNEQLVQDREEIYFGYQFATKAGSPHALQRYARDFYIEMLSRSSDALRASFAIYRALDESIPQNRARLAKGKLSLPILGFAGELFANEFVKHELQIIAEGFENLIIPDCGHYPAEEKPEVLLEAFEKFFSGSH